MSNHLDPSNEVEKGNRGLFENKIISILGYSIDLLPATPDPKSLSKDDNEVVFNLISFIFDYD